MDTDMVVHVTELAYRLRTDLALVRVIEAACFLIYVVLLGVVLGEVCVCDIPCSFISAPNDCDWMRDICYDLMRCITFH